MNNIVFFWLFLLAESIVAQNCQQTGCSPGFCCSKWGLYDKKLFWFITSYTICDFLVAVIRHYIVKEISRILLKTRLAVIHLVSPVFAVQNGDCKMIVSIYSRLYFRFLVVAIHHCIVKAIKWIIILILLVVIHLVNLVSVVQNGDCKMINLIYYCFYFFWIPSCGNTPLHCSSNTTTITTTTTTAAATTRFPSVISTTTTRPLIDPPTDHETTMTRKRFDCIFDQINANLRDKRWQGISN